VINLQNIVKLTLCYHKVAKMCNLSSCIIVMIGDVNYSHSAKKGYAIGSQLVFFFPIIRDHRLSVKNDPKR